MQRQLKNTLKAQKGNWETFTLNSGVVKFKKNRPSKSKIEKKARETSSKKSCAKLKITKKATKTKI